ncbi:MAG TPA: hypothetical protein VFB16_04570 [Bauldia sp.]|nr:hypothetical protein [Bauldia sp.]
MSDAHQYWVVGGAYRDLSFAALEEDSGRLHGPFRSYADALACWRQHSAETRSKASVRYSVVMTVPTPAKPALHRQEGFAP